jgi:hypothetical protein
MAEAARTVKYHVSDFLQDRHPYNVQAGFQAQREKDRGKVFNGLAPVVLDTLLDNVVDSSIDGTQRAIALRHLLAHSASAENKIALIRKGIVGRLAAVIRGDPSAMVEGLVHQLFRSLAILPQGCHAVVEEGGLFAVLDALQSRINAVEREEARVFAVSVISQMASNWAGRAWVLGIPCPKDFELVGHHVTHLSEPEREKIPDAVMTSTLSVMHSDRSSLKMLSLATQALAALSVLEKGLHQSLICGALREAAGILASYAEHERWIEGPDAPVNIRIIQNLATYIWHVGLDELGQRESSETNFVAALGKLLSTVLRYRDGKHDMVLKGTLAGAICSLVLHPDSKRQCIAPMDGSEDRCPLAVVIDLLRQVNALLEPLADARKSKQPLPFSSPTFEELTAVLKNCVQTVRLVVELPAGRQLAHVMLPDTPDSEAVRRQVFYSTAWQEEFHVKVY